MDIRYHYINNEGNLKTGSALPFPKFCLMEKFMKNGDVTATMKAKENR